MVAQQQYASTTNSSVWLSAVPGLAAGRDREDIRGNKWRGRGVWE